LKDSSPHDLIQAIRDVHFGQSSLHPAVARKLVGELQRPPQASPAEDPLTEREAEILNLVAQGFSNQEIADQLVLSERTVRTHVTNILGKLRLSNRTQAALYAIRKGMVDIHEGGGNGS
jgi:NarL family two-component system response regulator LiaR